MNTKKHPFHSVVRRLACTLSAVLAAMASLGDAVETNRINVTAKISWAQATTVDKLPAESDWGYNYHFGYYSKDSSKDASLWGRQPGQVRARQARPHCVKGKCHEKTSLYTTRCHKMLVNGVARLIDFA